MYFHFKEIRAYLKRHKHYPLHLFLDICTFLWWKVCGKKIAVITTGSGGVGDYLWIRNYLPLLRQRGYKVILIAMAHWKEIVESFDKDNVDIIRYFESCQSPKKIETLFFKLFKADVFLNFRIESMGTFVRSRKEYNNKGIPKDTFYEEKNNEVFSFFSPLPDRFQHRLPIIPLKEDFIPRPFAVFTERGNTQGSLSIEQSSAIVKCLTDKGYYVLLNGDKQRLATALDSTTFNKIIDGGQFTFPLYTWLVNKCSLVVTVNTSIYHFALQFEKPCVVISVNEYETIKLDAEEQEVVFNKELQKAFKNGTLMSYKKNSTAKLDDIESNRIVAAISRLV